MKPLKIILTSALLAFFSASGQNKPEGVIYYEMKVNVHANLSKDQLIYKAMIPEFAKSKIAIYLKNDFFRVKNLGEIAEKGDSKVSINMQSSGSDDVLCDNKQQVYYSFLSSGKQIYYTENKYNSTKAEFSKTSKKILGYNCFKVIQKGDKGETMELWITQELNTSANPSEPSSLKGVVLEITSPKVSWKATKIELKPQDQKLFEMPAGAKKITEEQAEDLNEEAIDELKKKAAK